MSVPHSPGSLNDKDSSFTAPHDSSSDSVFSYTEAEEKRVRLKLNLTVLPLLFLGFYVFQLERGNISNALTDGFLIKVGITQDEFNIGQALLFVGIILGELPSQYVLQWIGPQVSDAIRLASEIADSQLWISFQVMAFGLVATCQAFQHNYASFLVTRILLGITECGYIPGALYTLSTYYKRSELATVTAIFFLGNTLASATSGLLAYGILPLGAKHPQYHGWQWLMLIEGSMALCVSCLLIAFLPGSPIRPRPLFLPIRYFTDREERIVAHRVVLDDHAKSDSSRRLAMKEVSDTLGNWRIWPHVLMAIAYIAPTSALGT